MTRSHRILSLLSCLLLLAYCLAPAAFAETPLPEGAVKGLPERLAALDDQGNPVNSATGEYFFRVENMTLGECYTKNVQLMNLRDDATYNIYFCVIPLYKKGEIDLEYGTVCRFLMDGQLFYEGSVNGDGNIDLTEYYDCGRFVPGESHTLRCEITFTEFVVDQEVDNGWRLVDVDGEHVLRPADGEGHIEGEIEFKWLFCAKIDPDGGNPNTGIMMEDGVLWLLCIAVLGVLIAGLLVLIKKQKKEPRQ